MDDAHDNLIQPSLRRLNREQLAEQLAAAIEWLDDLESPLSAEQRAFAAQAMTASERIRRARERWWALDDGVTTPTDPTPTAA